METLLLRSEIFANEKPIKKELSLMERVRQSFRERVKSIESDLSWDKKRDLAVGFYTSWANQVIYSINVEGINFTNDTNYQQFQAMYNYLNNLTGIKESNYRCGPVEGTNLY